MSAMEQASESQTLLAAMSKNLFSAGPVQQGPAGVAMPQLQGVSADTARPEARPEVAARAPITPPRSKKRTDAQCGPWEKPWQEHPKKRPKQEEEESPEYNPFEAYDRESREMRPMPPATPPPTPPPPPPHPPAKPSQSASSSSRPGPFCPAEFKLATTSKADPPPPPWRSSAAKEPARAEQAKEMQWYANSGAGRPGEKFRARVGGGETGDKGPRHGNRGGRKSEYWNAWHNARKKGTAALAGFEEKWRDYYAYLQEGGGQLSMRDFEQQYMQ